MVSRHVGKGDSWKKEGEGEARISSGVKVAARLEKKGRLRRRAKDGYISRKRDAGESLKLSSTLKLSLFSPSTRSDSAITAYENRGLAVSPMFLSSFPRAGTKGNFSSIFRQMTPKMNRDQATRRDVVFESQRKQVSLKFLRLRQKLVYSFESRKKFFKRGRLKVRCTGKSRYRERRIRYGNSCVLGVETGDSWQGRMKEGKERKKKQTERSNENVCAEWYSMSSASRYRWNSNRIALEHRIPRVEIQRRFTAN